MGAHVYILARTSIFWRGTSIYWRATTQYIAFISWRAHIYRRDAPKYIDVRAHIYLGAPKYIDVTRPNIYRRDAPKYIDVRAQIYRRARRYNIVSRRLYKSVPRVAPRSASQSSCRLYESVPRPVAPRCHLYNRAPSGSSVSSTIIALPVAPRCRRL